MKRHTLALLLLAALLSTVPAFAQPDPPNPPPPTGERRPDRPDGHDPMADGFQFRNEPLRKFDMMRGYIDIVDRFSRLSRDPSTAGVAAVIAAADMLKQRGPDAAIEYFNKVLPEVKNEAVQRAIRVQLSELYRHNGQNDKALEQLDILIKSAGPDTGSPKQ